MRAVVCKTWGPPESLVIETLPDLSPSAGEVVIDVKAAGVNFPDVLIIQNKYQFKPELPFTPGSEVAGVVNAVGDGRAFEVDNNDGWLLAADGTESALQHGSKTLMASRIVDAIAAFLHGDSG